MSRFPVQVFGIRFFAVHAKDLYVVVISEVVKVIPMFALRSVVDLNVVRLARPSGPYLSRKGHFDSR